MSVWHKPERWEIMDRLRAEDPHGRRSDNDIGRQADLELLEWEINDISEPLDCIVDIKRVLHKIRELL